MAFRVSEDKISALEKAIGWPLPSALRQRLAVENGGEVHLFGDVEDIWWLHPVWDDSDRKRIKRTANHILRETEVAKQWGRFPADAVAIANNGSGDLLVVRKGDPETYRLDHETGDLVPTSVVWSAG